MQVRKIGICAAALCLAAMAAFAADAEQERKPGPNITEWLKGMQRKMEQLVPKRSITVNTGVAGVRGAKEDARTKLYWKGKASDEAVSEDEKKDFEACIRTAAGGDKTGAIRELEEFMKRYPDSDLIPDAKRTLDLVKQMTEPAKKEGPQGEAAEGSAR